MSNKIFDTEVFKKIINLPRLRGKVRTISFIDVLIGCFFFYCPIFLLINGQTGVTKVVSGVIFFSIGTLFLYLFIMKSRTLKADFIEWRFIMGYLFLYFILYYVIAIGICMLLSILGVISYQIG